MNRLIQSPRRAILIVFTASLTLRLALLPFLPYDPAWQLRQENGAVAASLIRTGNYANPYILPSGPTAHPLPVPTAWMALTYAVFGFTRQAEFVRCLFAAVSFSAMYAMIPWFAVRLGAGLRAGTAGGLAGALSPLHLSTGLFYGGLMEEAGALAMGVLLAAHLSRWNSRSAGPWSSMILGAAWGAAFHGCPPLLPVAAGCVAFELWWMQGRRARVNAALIVASMALVCLPWTLRNLRELHELCFMRSNFGLELRMGNYEGAHADMQVPVAPGVRPHPRIHASEAAKVAEWGEAEYMRRAGREAREWIFAHPAAFLRLTAARAFHFWFGPPRNPSALAGISLLTLLAMAGGWRVMRCATTPQRAALLIPLAAYPLVYYIVSYLPRYRVPLDWLVLLLAGAALWPPRRATSSASPPGPS